MIEKCMSDRIDVGVRWEDCLSSIPIQQTPLELEHAHLDLYCMAPSRLFTMFCFPTKHYKVISWEKQAKSSLQAAFHMQHLGNFLHSTVS